MNGTRRLSRRTALRGLGTALALPWLEAMAPAVGLAKGLEQGATAPLRMAFLYVPNGAHMPAWTPSGTGTDFELPPILRSLAPFRDDLLVLTGLTQDGAYAHGDGGGDHARALSTFLTGVHIRKTEGANIKAGTSVDQVAARKVGHLTRLPSLEIGIDRGAQSGNCDSGYSCAYSSNIAWSSESTPVAKEVNPRLVFERLFGGGSAAEQGASRARRQRYRASILDFVTEDARRLRDRLGRGDGRKVEEYLSAIREIERRIAMAEKAADVEAPEFPVPAGIPQDNREHIRLMADLLALAFQADVTRVCTYVLANEGSNRGYRSLGVPEGHHDLSHHGGDAEKHRKIATINAYHVEQLAYLLGKLKAMPEGEGSVLDNTMLVYGSGIGDGNRHNHDDLPILLAGRGGGTIRTGRHLVYADKTPLNDLFLSMLDRMDATIDHLGDSRGRLWGLEG